MTKQFDKGLSVRRMALGNALIDRAETPKTDFDEDFQTLINECTPLKMGGLPDDPDRISLCADPR